MTLTFVALALLGTSFTLASSAPVLEKVRKAREQTDTLRRAKCLPPAHRKYAVAARIPRLERPVALRREGPRLRKALSAGKHCLPTSPEGIIRYVFPRSTEDAAVRVAYCESRLWPYARNPSGASGLFQLMPGHWRGRFNPFDSWANSRYAYRLSDAGTNWAPWVCKP